MSTSQRFASFAVVITAVLSSQARGDGRAPPFIEGAALISPQHAAAILSADVFARNSLEDTYATPLQRATFKATAEYKRLLAAIKKERTSLLHRRIYVSVPVEISDYDLRRKRFTLILDSYVRRNSFGQAPLRCLADSCFPALPIQEVRSRNDDGSPLGWDRVLQIGTPQATAGHMEDSRNGARLFLVFNCRRVTVHKLKVVGGEGDVTTTSVTFPEGHNISLYVAADDEVLLSQRFP